MFNFSDLKKQIKECFGSWVKSKKKNYWNFLKEIRRKLLSYDVIHYFWFRASNLKQFKKIRIDNAKQAANNLINGLGGDKNLMFVKGSVYGLKIGFKSNYLIKKDLIEKSGGMGIKIEDKLLFSVFDRKETKMIVKQIKHTIKEAKRRYKPLDID